MLGGNMLDEMNECDILVEVDVEDIFNPNISIQGVEGYETDLRVAPITTFDFAEQGWVLQLFGHHVYAIPREHKERDLSWAVARLLEAKKRGTIVFDLDHLELVYAKSRGKRKAKKSGDILPYPHHITLLTLDNYKALPEDMVHVIDNAKTIERARDNADGERVISHVSLVNCIAQSTLMLIEAAQKTTHKGTAKHYAQLWVDNADCHRGAGKPPIPLTWKNCVFTLDDDAAIRRRFGLMRDCDPV
jgi:hypothetical protein